MSLYDRPNNRFVAGFVGSPEMNFIRKHALAHMRENNCDLETASLRVFSNADGAYGSNVNMLVDSGRWEVGSHGYDIHSFIKTAEDGSEGAALTNRAWLENREQLETLDEYRARVRADFATGAGASVTPARSSLSGSASSASTCTASGRS